MKIVALIPARGDSKSIPLKNIKIINGRPLIYWAIDAACECKYIDEVVVATDSVIIGQVVKKYPSDKVKIFERSAESATDFAPTEDVMLEVCKEYSFDLLVLIQATSPFISSKYLKEGIEKIFSGKYDSILSLVRQKRFIWEEHAKYVHSVNYDVGKRPMRQENKGFLVENGSFYIVRHEDFINKKCRLFGRIGYIEMPEKTYYEIDEEDDWKVVESLF